MSEEALKSAFEKLAQDRKDQDGKGLIRVDELVQILRSEFAYAPSAKELELWKELLTIEDYDDFRNRAMGALAEVSPLLAGSGKLGILWNILSFSLLGHAEQQAANTPTPDSGERPTLIRQRTSLWIDDIKERRVSIPPSVLSTIVQTIASKNSLQHSASTFSLEDALAVAKAVSQVPGIQRAIHGFTVEAGPSGATESAESKDSQPEGFLPRFLSELKHSLIESTSSIKIAPPMEPRPEAKGLPPIDQGTWGAVISSEVHRSLEPILSHLGIYFASLQLQCDGAVQLILLLSLACFLAVSLPLSLALIFLVVDFPFSHWQKLILFLGLWFSLSFCLSMLFCISIRRNIEAESPPVPPPARKLIPAEADELQEILVKDEEPAGEPPIRRLPTLHEVELGPLEPAAPVTNRLPSVSRVVSLVSPVDIQRSSSMILISPEEYRRLQRIAPPARSISAVPQHSEGDKAPLVATLFKSTRRKMFGDDNAP